MNRCGKFAQHKRCIAKHNFSIFVKKLLLINNHKEIAQGGTTVSDTDVLAVLNDLYNESPYLFKV